MMLFGRIRMVRPLFGTKANMNQIFGTSLVIIIDIKQILTTKHTNINIKLTRNLSQSANFRQADILNFAKVLFQVVFYINVDITSGSQISVE